MRARSAMPGLIAALVRAAALLAVAAPAWGLVVEDARPDEAPPGKAILWVRDCGKLARDAAEKRSCKPGEDQFSEDDSVTLDNWLRAAASRGRRYDEVWLYSGGGDSLEGFRVGRIFRKWQMTVRVPDGARCASACTVAFMGGMFRYIDKGGRYMVHSASAWANGFGCPPRYRCRTTETLAAIRRDPASGFVAYAESERMDARTSARRRLAHFQRTLLLPLGKDALVAENDAAFEAWGRDVREPLAYAQSAQLKQDVQRFESEGEAAAQDILMRIERDSMALAIRDLRGQVATFGPRAENALRMIEVMFQTSILETATLTEETLLRMGFVTRDFNPGN